MLVVICGFPGSGKTTLSNMVCDEFGYQFYDMDDSFPEEYRERMRNNELITDEERDAFINSMIEEFKDFLKTYKVMGLAVAFIMGIYLGRLVQALVTAFISPILTVIFLALNFVSQATVDANSALYPTAFNPVLFLSELITFLIVAFVVFVLVKITERFGIK